MPDDDGAKGHVNKYYQAAPTICLVRINLVDDPSRISPWCVGQYLHWQPQSPDQDWGPSNAGYTYGPILTADVMDQEGARACINWMRARYHFVGCEIVKFMESVPTE